MDSEDATRIFRELSIGNQIPCQLEWNGRRYIITVPLYATREVTMDYPVRRPMDMRDLNAEEEGIVIGLGQRAGLIVEYQKQLGTMKIW